MRVSVCACVCECECVRVILSGGEMKLNSISSVMLLSRLLRPNHPPNLLFYFNPFAVTSFICSLFYLVLCLYDI